jgi:hypothetical protein
MGCGILYRMLAEQIGLCATLATRRTDSRMYADATESGRKPAMLMQEAPEASGGGIGLGSTATSNDAAVVDGGYPARLRWLVDSLKNP